MFEDVRLVIWDLDETFWEGTLTEGGIRYKQDHHDIVIELCSRGIMNSICSRNEHRAVQDIFIESGLRDYFVFPSIDWSEKADRIAQIVEAAQLRPQTVLFVDDNPRNRAQAAAALPGLQVADETIIGALLTDPGLAGKADPELTRLQQYKLLESRNAEMRKAAGDTAEFLRQSGITVSILYDVENHLDRAVELINRTNQLNFTKRRLSEDQAEASAQLLDEIAPFHAKAGLVSVRDRYGDYGICGFFLVVGLAAWGTPRLQHFTFSCRTLGMGVEQWVYDLLGHPHLQVAGDVLSNLSEKVDWINVAVFPSADEARAAKRFRDVRIRGGCELEVIEHYFRAHSASVTTEVVAMRGDLYMPRQNSTIFSQAAKGLSRAQTDLIAKLGMDKSFYETRMFDPCEEGTLIIYSPTGDAMLLVHRHKETGFQAPVWFREVMLPTNPLRTDLQRAEFDRISSFLSLEFDPLPFEDMAKYAAMYRTILEKVPSEALFVVVLPNRWRNLNGVASEHSVQAALNETFRTVGEDYDNVSFIEMTSLIESITEVTEEYLHFNRAVYHRLYEEIGERYRVWMDSRRKRNPIRALVGALLKPKAVKEWLRQSRRLNRDAIGAGESRPI